ncbi:hemerythrin domain-containing protein [Nonomuraea sp. MCN248]|uniref:Hemerythrin domain-containing protein n=1 Tax=Nonomuraea corallina TaxID=2989783 RepID=A0ABT4S7Y7_9ACTN|nr:hemerythrin domain-containing protein [Nonomuraea corallina]MDA0633280.1 hemerythrin domain-containing protein [Nonomuraea corallina]
MTVRNDVISLVQADHRRIEVLFKRLLLNQQDPGPAVSALHALLTAHFRAEEDVFYPLLNAHHGFAQHKEAEVHLDALRRADAGTPELTQALHQLVVSVMAHFCDEETTILPILARGKTGEELAALGAAFQEARQRELDALRGRPAAGEPRRASGRFGTGKTRVQEVLTTL